MAELDDKKKNPQDIGYTDFQEEYEKHNNQPEEEKKGFFQRLWESIQKIFGAIRDFIVNIFRPVDYTIMTEEQIKKYQNQQRPTEPNISQEENSREDVILENSHNMDEQVVDEENLENDALYEALKNPDVMKLALSVEGKDTDIMKRMHEITQFNITEENKEAFAEYVTAVVELFNEAGPELMESQKEKIINNNPNLNFDKTALVPKAFEQFNKFVAELTGREDLVINTDFQEKISSIYVAHAKDNFETEIYDKWNRADEDIDVIVGLNEGYDFRLTEAEVKGMINKSWDKIVSGSITTDKVFEEFQKLLDKQIEKARESIKHEEPSVEYESDYSGFDMSYMPVEEDVSLEDEVTTKTEYGIDQDKFAEILSGCETTKDGKFIIKDFKTANALLATINIDPEEPDAEAQYVKNTILEAVRIVSKGDTALWSPDGAEKYEEKSFADRLFDDDVTIEDDEEPVAGDNSTIIPDDEIGH